VAVGEVEDTSLGMGVDAAVGRGLGVELSLLPAASEAVLLEAATPATTSTITTTASTADATLHHTRRRAVGSWPVLSSTGGRTDMVKLQVARLVAIGADS
jgi:hypothetical protein